MSFMRVNTNVSSMRSLRAVKGHSQKEEETQLKISSSNRIYKAAVDPAGLAISDKMKASIRSQMQASRNINQGFSIFQVAEASVSTMQEIGVRLKELAVQAASDTVSDRNRQLISIEFNQLKSEIDRMAGTTAYNDTSLLNGNSSALDLQVGIGSSGKENVLQYHAGKVDMGIKSLGILTMDVDTKLKAQSAITKVDTMLGKLNRGRTEIGSVLKRLESALVNSDVSKENTSAGKSRIRDADLAVETSIQAKTNIQKAASTQTLSIANSRGKGILNLLG
jgi:flagellin